MKQPYPLFIIFNTLVTLVFSACIEQQITTQYYDISVNVPFDKLSIQYYTICADVEDELFGKVGNFTCSKTNGCASTNVAPFQQQPVIDILNNMFMDNKNVSYLKSICRRVAESTDGFISNFNDSVLIDNGYFFDSATRFLAAWDTTDFQNLRRSKISLYRGRVKRFRLDNTTEYISFSYKTKNYTTRVNEERGINNNIINQEINASLPKLDSKYLPYIKITNLYLPYCKNSCSCKGISDFINFSPKSEESQLNLYISLSFNVLAVIIIVCLLVFILCMPYKNHWYAKIYYSNKNPQGKETGKDDNDRPSSYLKFVNKYPKRKDQPNESSSPKEMPTELHEYFTVGSDLPKHYEVLTKDVGKTERQKFNHNRKVSTELKN